MMKYIIRLQHDRIWNSPRYVMNGFNLEDRNEGYASTTEVEHAKIFDDIQSFGMAYKSLRTGKMKVDIVVVCNVSDTLDELLII